MTTLEIAFFVIILIWLLILSGRNREVEIDYDQLAEEVKDRIENDSSIEEEV